MPSAERIARAISTECACLRARQAARALSRRYDAELRSAGVRISQLTILVGVAMFGADGAPISALAEAIALDRTTLSRNLQPLVREGLLRQASHPRDARSRVVVLSPKGEKTLADAYPLWKRAQQATRESLGEEGLAGVTRALELVASRIVGGDQPADE